MKSGWFHLQVFALCIVSFQTACARGTLVPPRHAAAQFSGDATAVADLARELVALGRGAIEQGLAQQNRSIERLIVRNVEVEVVADPGAFAVSMLDERRVLISTGFLTGLYTHVRGLWMEHRFGVPDLADRYWQHWNDGLLYQDVELVPLDEFAGLDAAQRSVWESPAVQTTVFNLFYSAVVYVLAHEFAHHVHADLEPDLLGQDLESACDDWAAGALLLTGTPPIPGAVAALSYVWQLERDEIIAEQVRPHPHAFDRVASIMRSYFDPTKRLYAAQLGPAQAAVQIAAEEQAISRFEHVVERASIERQVSYLERMAQSGDAAASYQLGLLYSTGTDVGKDLERARVLFESAAFAGLPQAQARTGSLYYEDGSSPDSDLRAYAWARVSEAAGLHVGSAETKFLRAKLPGSMATVLTCFDRYFVAPLEQCLADGRSGCVDKCVATYGNSEAVCTNVSCASERQRAYDFQRCHGYMGRDFDTVIADCLTR